jgi:isopentenyl diphosphate isomerase/L-lactate dehydrogenase-like FMN-dependent dehydrogenase
LSAEPATIADLQRLAELEMAPTQRDFVRRGTGGNWTRDRNRVKLNEIAVNPRMLVSIANRDLSTTVLGHQISFPVMCAPAGGQCGSHPDGELATARAAGAAGTLMALPISSGYGLEEVANAATGPLWFQHIHYNDGVSEELLPRLKPAGYSAVVLTVDVLGPFPVRAHASTRTPGKTSTPVSPEPGDMAPMFGSLRNRPDLLDEHGTVQWEPPNITWDRLDWLKTLSGDLPLVVKGIRNVEDAALCVEHGVDGIVVSNHGGRQFDGGLSAIEILPQVADAVGDRLEVYMDSGVRSGLDAFRAMALGARAVFVGRPVHWGLAYAGEDGVRRALEILRGQLDRVLAFSGRATPADVRRSDVVPAD